MGNVYHLVKNCGNQGGFPLESFIVYNMHSSPLGTVVVDVEQCN